MQCASWRAASSKGVQSTAVSGGGCQQNFGTCEMSQRSSQRSSSVVFGEIDALCGTVEQRGHFLEL